MALTPSTINAYSSCKKVLLFAAISTLLFLCVLHYTHPNVFLPKHNKERGTSLAVTGVTLAANMVGQILASLVAPSLINKYPSKWLLLVTSFVLACHMLTFSVLDYIPTDNGLWYGMVGIVSRFIGGTFGGVTKVICFAALVSMYPKQVGTVTSIGEAILNASLGFAPFLGSVLYSIGGFTWAFLCPGIAMACTVFPCAMSPQLTNSNAGTRTHSWKRLLDPLILFPLWHLASAQVIKLKHYATMLK